MPGTASGPPVRISGPRQAQRPAPVGLCLPDGFIFPLIRAYKLSLRLSDRTECGKKAGFIWLTGFWPSCQANLQKKQGEIGKRRVHGRVLLVY